ncbi:MAG TPA: hypothetical protein VMM13_06860, partial [Euzebya sp.]|nr:hypothetical protein [Euzebya sp.]
MIDVGGRTGRRFAGWLRQLSVRPVAGEEALAIVRRLHTLVADGRLPMRLWDGSMLGPSDPAYRLVLTLPTAVRALLPPSDLRSGRAYIDGLIDIDGDAVAALSAVWDLDMVGGLRRRQLARAAADLLRLPAPEADGDVGRP